MQITEFFERRQIPFQRLGHTECYGAQRLAESLHSPGREVAKSVLLRADHNYRFIVAVLPATHRIDFDRLSMFLGGAALELATEEEIAARCPDCERGVLPPFGTHYGAQTIVDRSLSNDPYIVFEIASHREAIRMKYSDYYAFEHPLVADFAVPVND